MHSLSSRNAREPLIKKILLVGVQEQEFENEFKIMSKMQYQVVKQVGKSTYFVKKRQETTPLRGALSVEVAT